MTKQELTPPVAMTASEHLNQLYREYNRAKYPNMPEYAIPGQKYTDKTSGGLRKMTCDWFKFNGGYGESIPRMGHQITVYGKDDKARMKAGLQPKFEPDMPWVSGSGVNGTTDVSVIFPGGQSGRVEIKIGHDTPSPDQYKYRNDVVKAGAFHIFAHNFEEVYRWYNECMSKICHTTLF